MRRNDAEVKNKRNYNHISKIVFFQFNNYSLYKLKMVVQLIIVNKNKNFVSNEPFRGWQSIDTNSPEVKFKNKKNN